MTLPRLLPRRSAPPSRAAPRPAGLLRRWTQLIGAFAGFGLVIAAMVRSGLGLGPWDAFHYGLHLHTGLSVGVASALVGLVVLAASMLLGVRPGLGTLANVVLIAVFTDLMLPLVPPAGGPLMGAAYYAVALVLMGPLTGMYIGAGLGSGPRDGLMLAVSARTRWSVRRVRTLIELTALGSGWLMGGTIGVGTVILALAAGPLAQWGLRLFGVLPPSGAAPAAVVERRAA